MSVFTLKVSGELACFTRPELKVERFSYPIMTPSAARAIFDAIYLDFDKSEQKRPVFYWQVCQIALLTPPRFIALMRNEVKEKASERAIQSWRKDPSKVEPIFADAMDESKGRTQRQTMALKNVAYLLRAEPILFRPDHELRRKIEESFVRRASRGQCFFQPYLGCREFAAFFELIPEGQPEPTPVAHTESLGWMLYDVFDLSRPGYKQDAACISLFAAEVRDGVLDVPPYTDSRVLKPGLGGLFDGGERAT